MKKMALYFWRLSVGSLKFRLYDAAIGTTTDEMPFLFDVPWYVGIFAGLMLSPLIIMFYCVRLAMALVLPRSFWRYTPIADQDQRRRLFLEDRRQFYDRENTPHWLRALWDRHLILSA